MTEALEQYGLLALFAIVTLQTMGVGGLPGKTSLVAASILAADGVFELWHVLVLAAFGVSLGGYAGYAIGRVGGRSLLLGDHLVARRLAKPLGITERFFAAHGPKAVFLARFFPGVKVVAAPLAGVARMPWAAFALWHTLGAVAFALVFGLTSYYAGRGTIAIVEHLGVVALLPLAGTAGIAWLGLRTLRRRRVPAWWSEPAPVKPVAGGDVVARDRAR